MLALLASVMGATFAPAQAQPSPAADSQRIARVVAQLDSLARATEFSGVVLLAHGSTPVVERSYGLADRAAKRPNTIDTRFNLGSINKFFTATAIRQLAAQGKLALGDTLIRLLPDYPTADVARRVTIRQLLEHRSGIGGNIFEAPSGKTRADLRRNQDFLELFATAPLQFEPGSKQRYSNAGYVVLGAVIERVSGMSYYDYVREHIFRPAGMT
ncbi:MAG: serine hydrolase domain-containing protein, partial [Gemmatimonadales bacterium]